MKIILKIIFLLSPTEKIRGVLVFFMMLVMAFLDMLGVASIMPFVAVISNPDIIYTNELLQFLYHHAQKHGVQTEKSFIFLLGLLVVVALVLSLTFKAATVYAQTRFSLMREYTIGMRLLDSYLHRPYDWFLERNSADLSKNVLAEVNIVIAEVLIPLMNITAQSLVSVALIMLLLYVDPILALSMALILVGAYSTVYILTKNYLNRIGHDRTEANKDRYIAVSEAFGAVKEIKLKGIEKVYLNRFSEPANRYAQNLSAANLIGQLPRFALELITFGGLLVIILYLMDKSNSFSEVLPIISVFALAGYRLMPSMQGVYRSATQLKFAGSALDNVIKDLKSEHKSGSIYSYSQQKPELCEFTPQHIISLVNFTFSYPGKDTPILENLNLEIDVGAKIGFVGPTGGGKTTIVDSILGLLRPNEGCLMCDGVEINDGNKNAWQNIIGYVQQSIYIADDTLAANIAFGTQLEKIDMERVRWATEAACLHEFVERELNAGYFTKLGERGVRLSGGQRQRIGIARALYQMPRILVLDEATSALDNVTENAILESIQGLNPDITILMIAHRLSTVTECDKIFYVENGMITASGSYTEVLAQNSNFRSMHGA